MCHNKIEYGSGTSCWLSSYVLECIPSLQKKVFLIWNVNYSDKPSFYMWWQKTEVFFVYYSDLSYSLLNIIRYWIANKTLFVSNNDSLFHIVQLNLYEKKKSALSVG